MQAIINERYGKPDVMELREVPKPVPAADEVLIKVMATSLNAFDWHMMMADPFFVRFMSGFITPKIRTLGADVAGVVEAVGEDVTRFQPGDAVYGELAPTGCGGLAEYVTTTEKHLAPKPESLTFVEAAAIPMAALTAWQGLRDVGGLQPGMRVLVNGASGGVGTFAVQIAKALGAEVTAVCSTSKVDQARALGADHVIDYTREDFTRNGQQYDLIFGANGDRSLGDYARSLAPEGVFVMAGGSYKQMFQTILLGPLKSRGDRQFKSFTAASNPDHLLAINDLITAGRIKPAVDRCYPLAEAPDAMRYLIDGHARGKIVVVVDPAATTM